MKCPNCSFLNTDDAEECKICGYALNPTPPSKSRYALDDADLDKSVDAIFGTSNKSMPKNLDKRFEEYANMPDDDEEPTITDKELHWLETLKRDMATVDEEFDHLKKESNVPLTHPENLAQETAENVLEDNHAKKQEPEPEAEAETETEHAPEPEDAPDENVAKQNDEPIYTSSQAAETEPTTDTSEAENPLDEDEAYDVINLNLLAKDPKKYEKDIEAFHSGSVDDQESTLEEEYYQNATRRNRLLILLVLAVIVILVLFKLLSGSDKTETPAAEDPIDNQVEEPITQNDDMTSEVLAEQTGIFFGQLKAYVNDDNIAVLSRFENSQNALEQLNRFKNEGSLDDFRLTMPAIDVIDPMGTPITIDVAIDRTVNDKSVTSEDTWHFNWIYIDTQWLIQSLEIQSKDGTTTVDDTPSSNNPPSTSTPSPETSSPANTIKPEGFSTTLSFTGGIITDGQDVSNIRFGRHDAFDRLVFDLATWTGNTGPGENVEESCHYEATISDDGKTITLLLSGARGASATLPDLAGSDYFSAISVFYPKDDSAVGFNITLKQASAYKVFNLKTPGRIVVDVMPK